MQKSLDLDAVRAFVLVADLASFTRAADALQIAQAAVSLKIKKLEARLDRRLLDRTPRRVQLSEDGRDFIELARDLLMAHDRALATDPNVPKARVSIGISDHVAGPELPFVLKKLATYDTTILMEVHIAASRDLLNAYEDGDFDAIVVRGEDSKHNGKVLFEENVNWIASPNYAYHSDEPLRLATLSASCGMRTLCVDALDSAGIAWFEIFVGGSVAAVGAAASAGLAVTALAARLAPPGTVNVGEKFDLPRLPPSQVISKQRQKDRRTLNAVQIFLATFKGPASSR